MSKGMDIRRLAEEFTPLVRRIARRYEGRGADREDLEQEGYLALIVIARRFGVQEMARCLKNHLPGYVRDAAKKMWRPAGLIPLASDEDDGGMSFADLLPDARAEYDVEELELMESLERFLAPEDMELARALAEGLTQQEIASLTGESRSSVARRIARIRKRLSA